MKKFLVSYFFFLVSSALFAQQAPKQDRLIVDLFHDNWLNKPDSIKTKWYSYGVAVSMLYDSPIEKSNFSFAAGADIACHNVHNNARLVNYSDSVHSEFNLYSSGYKFKKNKLSTNYADAVAELRYRTKPDSKGFSWKFSIGGRYGYLLNVHDMLKDGSGRYKTYVFPNVTKQRYGLHFRAAYGRVAVFGFYSLTNLFEKNKGAKITPFSAGVSIMPM